PTNSDNIEHIWVIPYDEVLGEGMNIAQMTLHYPSQLTFRLQEQPWNGYAALEEFYNSYEDDDERRANNFLVGPQLDTQGDPILDLSFEGSRDASGAAVVYTPRINELAPLALRDAGARLFKFNFKMDQLNNMDNDFPIFRYGDVLLMKAEAKARLNNNWNDEEVLMLVNMVRTRAGVAPFISITADDFLTERGREMFMENYRRQDLIRFGAWGDPWWEKQAHSNPNLRFFPIPLESINAAATGTFNLTQNPGY
nr:RagB/SusD family nutrient uptake outer membrane protein [Bacteroidota bacterium]